MHITRIRCNAEPQSPENLRKRTFKNKPLNFPYVTQQLETMANKQLPIFANRRQLSQQAGVDLSLVYKAFRKGEIIPDAYDVAGNALVKLSRVDSIRDTLTKPEVMA
jgi:hypothetical protein